MKLPPLPSPHMVFAYTDEQLLEIQEYAIAAIKLNLQESQPISRPNSERMSIDSEKGTLVLFDALGGYDYEKRYAETFLTLGHMYKVDYVSIGQYATEVQLQGIQGLFNPSLFAKVG